MEGISIGVIKAEGFLEPLIVIEAFKRGASSGME